MKKDFAQITVGGPAGFGIMRAGWLLGKALTLGGLYVAAINEYPSRIEGGHNYVDVCFSEREIYSHWPKSEVIIAFDKLAVETHKNRVEEGGIILYDSTLVKSEIKIEGVATMGIPFTELARKNKLREITRNTIALGSAFAALNFDLSILYKAIERAFKEKESIIEINKKAANIGFNYYHENHGITIKVNFKPNTNAEPKYFISGNEAIAVGAAAVGLTWYSAYPMTPASPILHFFARKQFEYGMVTIQPESEIAAILMAIGASYAGARAMTGTSGGGFSLMTESFGMAAMGETPILVVVVQRPGPSTGLATYTAQGDLRFVLHASQGEFPRFVASPGDVKEHIYYAEVLLNLVEKFQVPGVLLTDKNLGEGYQTFDDPSDIELNVDRGKVVRKVEGEYKRYLITDDGVSPIAYPGTPNAVNRSNSFEHNERGISNQSAENAVAMNNKRWRKYRFMREEIKKYQPVKTYGDRRADLAIIFWGGTKGAVLDAYRLLEKEGIRARLVQVVFMAPFPDEEVKKALEGASTIIDVENNVTSPLISLLREYTCIDATHRINKYDGRPFSAYDVYVKIKEVLKK